MYEAGTPDILSVLVESGGYEELVNRTEYLNRIHGLDEAVVAGCGNCATRSGARSPGCAPRRTGSNRPATRSPAKRMRWPSARSAVQQRQSTLVAARRSREDALAKITQTEEDLDGDVASIQAELAATLAGTGSAPLPPGRSREATAAA